MIGNDTSISIDQIFDYNKKRTVLTDKLFTLIGTNELPIYEPDLFKIELISQLVRRIEQIKALAIGDEYFSESNFLDTSDLFTTALLVATETVCRAIDVFFISAAKKTQSILVSNDKIQTYSSKMFQIPV